MRKVLRSAAERTEGVDVVDFNSEDELLSSQLYSILGKLVDGPRGQRSGANMSVHKSEKKCSLCKKTGHIRAEC
eukprot:6737900-Karenia_brevis.AAC.1